MSLFRFQGTDGVRRPVMRSSHPSLEGVTPQEAFIEHGVLTGQFMELYSYCHISQLVESGAMKQGEEFVIGWDPRDPSGEFTSSAVRGLARGGARVVSIGMAPTPCVALYMLYTGSAGSMVITASHNPPSYNGIKIFTRRGFKLLPADDLALSRRVMNTRYEDVERVSVSGKIEDHHDRAIEVFRSYSLDPRNSWIEKAETLREVVLIVDTANGALSGIAGEIMEQAGFGRVIPVNADVNGQVNFECGVAELDTVRVITPEMIDDGGRFHTNKAIVTLFGEGRAAKADGGGKLVSLAVFDGDGDRFYRVDYDPASDTAHVLAGDDTAIIQAGFMLEHGAGPTLFLNTVESDLSATATAEKMGYPVKMSAVGDKWILLNAALIYARNAAPGTMGAKLASVSGGANTSSAEIEKAMDNAGYDMPWMANRIIGAEQSGHCLTAGALSAMDGREIAAFQGNGIKSCLNTFCATAVSRPESTPHQAPFQRGVCKTIYVYYVDKSKWKRGTPLWNEVKKKLTDAIKTRWPDAQINETIRPEEPDMLYIRIVDRDGALAGVFIRNSGTEDKTGVSLRGPAQWEGELDEVGSVAAKALMKNLKDKTCMMGRAEMELLKKARENGAPQNPVNSLGQAAYAQLLNESGLKQGLLDSARPGARLTDLGIWYLSESKEGQ